MLWCVRLLLVVVAASLGCAAIAGFEDEYVVGGTTSTAAGGSSAGTTPTASAGGTATGTGTAAAGGSSGSGGAAAAGAAATGGSGGAGAGGGAATGGSGGSVVGYCEEPGLVACYRFEGDGQDDSPAGNHAVVSGLQYVAGQAGQAARFDSGSLVTIPADDSFGLAALTLEMWLRPASLPSSGRFGLIDHPGRWSAWLRPDGVYCRGVGPAPIPTGSWSHVACVNDGTTMQVYVDGVEITSGGNSLDPNPTTADIHIGSDAPDGGDQYQGDMDEMRLFDHARSQPQICAAAGGSGC